MQAVRPGGGIEMRVQVQSDDRYTIRVVDRALDILTLLADGEPRLLAQVSGAAGLHTSTAFRVLATLAGRNFVERDAQTGHYTLGIASLELARAYQDASYLRRVALPTLQRLRDDTGETVHLAVLDNLDVVYLDKQQSFRAVAIMSSRVGARLPAYCTGLGKALLAYTDPDLVRAHFDRVGLRRYTDATLPTIDSLLHELEQVRRRGFAFDHGEHEPEVRCVAAPIFGPRGAVSAALSVAGPASRLDPLETNHALIERTVAAARAVSGKLAGREPPQHAVRG